MNNSRSHTALVSAVVRDLCAMPEVRAMKLHQGRYGIRGTPDLLVVARGRALLLEAKTGTADMTPSQRCQASLWKLAGAVVSVVRTREEAVSIVREVLEGETQEHRRSAS